MEKWFQCGGGGFGKRPLKREAVGSTKVWNWIYCARIWAGWVWLNRRRTKMNTGPLQLQKEAHWATNLENVIVLDT